MIFHSIRWRLQLWHGLMLCAVLAGFGFTAHRLQLGNEMRRVDQELQPRLGAILEALRRPPPVGPGRPGDPWRPAGPRDGERRGPPPLDRSEDPQRPPRGFRIGPNRAAMFEGGSNAFYYVVWTREGEVVGRSETAPDDVPMPEFAAGATLLTQTRMRGVTRELYEFTRPGECVLVGRPITPELAELRQLALWLLAMGGGVLVLGLAGGWWLATRAIRPIEDISATAARIATGNLSHRINAEDTDNELGQLASVLNSTFSRLESSFERQRQFTADASHELRTPVAVILSHAQATLARERSPAEYRETIEACQRAAQRMRALTDSLLTLARLDAGQGSLTRERVDLGRIASECFDLLRPLADTHRIIIQADLQPAECLGDLQPLAQVITNLVTNAIVHNKPGGEASVSTRSENGKAIISVTDNGPGIPAEDLPRLFERFYRADQSRSGATGGTGLGLAITKAIVESHGGTIDVSSSSPTGTRFTVFLPGGPA